MFDVHSIHHTAVAVNTYQIVVFLFKSRQISWHSNTPFCLLQSTIVFIISQIFKSNGFDLFLVGGAVRDFLLNREISDFDFVTNALPDDLAKLFPSGNKAFIKYGVIIVEVENKKIEIASFRKEVYVS